MPHPTKYIPTEISGYHHRSEQPKSILDCPAPDSAIAYSKQLKKMNPEESNNVSSLVNVLIHSIESCLENNHQIQQKFQCVLHPAAFNEPSSGVSKDDQPSMCDLSLMLKHCISILEKLKEAQSELILHCML